LDRGVTSRPFVVASLLLLGCAASIPKPPAGPAVRERGVEVPFPPPPGRAEVVPEAAKPEEVWVDGQWDWDGEAWQWTPGRWRVPPANAYFTPWSAERHRDGKLFFVSAAWRTQDGRRIADPFGESACPIPGAEAAP
jgi:hypothetical protein